MDAVAHAPAPRAAASGAVRQVPAVMDLEASGFGRSSYPIEIGYVLSDGTSFCTLVQPAEGWTHWDPSAEAVHHIPREALARHGRPVPEVARLLNERLQGLTLYSDGWGHDYAWLGALFEEAGMAPRFRLDSLRAVLTDWEAARWKTSRDQIAREFSVARHRASVDAWLLQQTWLRLQRGPDGRCPPDSLFADLPD